MLLTVFDIIICSVTFRASIITIEFILYMIHMFVDMTLTSKNHSTLTTFVLIGRSIFLQCVKMTDNVKLNIIGENLHISLPSCNFDEEQKIEFDALFFCSNFVVGVRID